jgi:hypothetical protein
VRSLELLATKRPQHLDQLQPARSASTARCPIFANSLLLPAIHLSPSLAGSQPVLLAMQSAFRNVTDSMHCSIRDQRPWDGISEEGRISGSSSSLGE